MLKITQFGNESSTSQACHSRAASGTDTIVLVDVGNSALQLPRLLCFCVVACSIVALNTSHACDLFVFATLGWIRSSANSHAKKDGDTGDAAATYCELTSNESTSPGSLRTTRRHSKSGATLETPPSRVAYMNCGTGMATLCCAMSSMNCGTWKTTFSSKLFGTSWTPTTSSSVICGTGNSKFPVVCGTGWPHFAP